MGRSIVNLDDLTANNLGTFKKINEVCLPTRYPEAWYKDSLNSDRLVKLAFYSELPVGAIRGKTINASHNLPNFEVATSTQVSPKIIPNAVYIESLAVLKAYRGLHIASELLNWLIEETKQKFIHSIVLHVHVDNEDAIGWYTKKGFVKGELVKDYYKEQGLTNPDAYILSLTI